MMAAILLSPFAAVSPAAQSIHYFDSHVAVMEAENFTVTGGWRPERWAHSNVTRFASTVANVFHSRRAYLHAPADATSAAVATATVAIRTPGRHMVLVRYEAAYRFEVPFMVTVSQGGKARASAVYGLRRTPKVWAFGVAHGGMCAKGILQGECRWSYGATENMVWEGTNVTAELEAGEATITLQVDPSTHGSVAPLASRNVDTVVLTPNASDVETRLLHEGPFLALDGLLSQGGEVFARVHNLGPANLSLVLPYTYIHSPYFSMHLVYPLASPDGKTVGSGCSRGGGPLCPRVDSLPPGKASEWIDVGNLMDVYKQSTWNFAEGNYTVEFAVPSAGAAVPADVPADGALLSTTAYDVIATFNASRPANATSGGFQAVIDHNTRDTRRMRTQGSDFDNLMAALDEQTAGKRGPPLNPKGKPPSRVPVFANTFSRYTPGGGGHKLGYNVSAYDEKQRRFEKMFAISIAGGGWTPATVERPNDATYTDIRGSIHNLTSMVAMLKDKYAATHLADKVRVVSVGDEVGMPKPKNQSDFAHWVKASGLTPTDVGCPHGFSASCSYSPGRNTSLVNPLLFYQSNKCANAFGISTWQAMTKAIRSVLTKAHVGANFSPVGGGVDTITGQAVSQAYTGSVAQWIRPFREGGMTLPWTEDWIWQSPVGTQQMQTLMLDVFRSGVRRQSAPFNPPPTDEPAPPILSYIMAHFPGNTPTSWERQMWGDLAHGLKMIDLFQWGYTCDYVDADGGSYEAVRANLHALGTFDDIVADGVAQAQGAKAALLYSETADIYADSTGTPGAEKRATYIALRHAMMPVDIVTEDDCIAGDILPSYSALYLTEPHVSASAATAIAKWVAAGGRLYVAAGAGLLDEKNASNVAMASLLGVHQHGTYVGNGTDIDRVNPYMGGPAPVQFIKQDLPFAPTLDTVSVHAGAAAGASLPALGAKSLFTLTDDAQRDGNASVLGTFSDGSPAIVHRTVGRGTATYTGFLGGLAYFAPAIPKRPVDRSSSDAGFNHFVPTAFDAHARALIAAPLADVEGAVPILTSEPLVEAGVITAAKVGSAIPLINWAGKRVRGLTVTLNFDVAPFDAAKATLAKGGPLKVGATADGKVVFTLDLELGDAIVLRP